MATVNGRAISRAAWEQATRLDAAMNTLAGQPSPNPEETLGRLINETLVLEARMPARSFSEADAEARLRALMGHWQVSGDTLIDTLDTVGLTRQDLITSISHLLIVENVIQQLTAEGIDVNEWLTRARNQAEVGLYQPITATTSPEPEPEPELATAPAPPTPALPEPPADLPIQPYPDAVAPDFTLTTLRGESVTLSELRGRPTIINFWASWCPPCRRELPALQATYDAHQDDINFLAVNLKEPKGTVRSFAEDIGLTFPILLDEQGQVGDQLYQVRGIPTTFFVNARGVVVNRHVGPLDEATIEAYLQPLLAPRRNERSRSSG